MIARNEQKKSDTWDLGSIYESQKEWERDFQKLNKEIKKCEKLRGRMKLSLDDFHFVLESLESAYKKAESLSRLNSGAGENYALDYFILQEL